MESAPLHYEKLGQGLTHPDIPRRAEPDATMSCRCIEKYTRSAQRHSKRSARFSPIEMEKDPTSQVIWIFLTNLCFTCMLTKLQTVITLLEFLVLLVIGTFVLRCVTIVLQKIWLHFNDAMIAQTETSPPVHPYPAHENLQPVAQELLFNSPVNYPNNIQTNSTASNYAVPGTSSTQFGAAGASFVSGIPHCAHRTTLKSPVTTLRDKNSDASSFQARPNVSN
ncbi:hypothetical protein HNY73_013440 [Argiope bruennichi]|uniref:Uncharacterized protein n=1 Tax=Argiope bruennichi TaxID=94029 RepID=A0A8T0F2R7_ARGBR|nr:hypothetical protein HNY73_013440 [Argiope bruennichi]